MSAEPPSTAMVARARAALTDPGLREWDAAGGVRTEPAGLRATFDAMSMRVVMESDPGGAVRFEAWRTPRISGAILAAALAGVIYVVLDHYGVAEFPILVAIVLAAYFLPTAILPGYRVSGKVAEGRVALRIRGSGLLARPARVEATLRFYLAK